MKHITTILSDNPHFSMKNLKTKSLALLIEHLPCCILSAAAAFVGLPFLNHNILLELFFALGGALGGEYIGHKLFHKGTHCHNDTAKRYTIALAIGMITWGIHQLIFHDHAF